MRDLQNESTGFPPRPIQAVGVSGIKGILPLMPYPAQAQPREEHQAGQSAKRDDCPRETADTEHPRRAPILHLVATFTASCPLPASQRGLNMSRMGRKIYDFLLERGDTGVDTLSPLALALMEAHGAAGASVSASFEYPMEVASPVTHTIGIKCVHVMLQCDASKGGTTRDLLTLATSETSLCPCSKLMSLVPNAEDGVADSGCATGGHSSDDLGRGAHNQIVDISATVAAREQSTFAPISRTIEDIYGILSSCASAVTYPVLRRADEKYVTEQAWSTPRFVEDIVRLAADKLDAIHPIHHYSISAKSHESIHSDGIEATATILAPEGNLPQFSGLD